MKKQNKRDYFLMVNKINLCPTIKKNTIKMIEQVMNAVILTYKGNIQSAIENIIDIENICKKIIKEDYLSVLEKIKVKMESINIFIGNSDDVKIMHVNFIKSGYFYFDVGTQAVIDIEFGLQKKVKYNGKKIEFLDTYVEWIRKIIDERRTLSMHNPDDKLLYYKITPKTLDQLIETENIILEETKKYVKEYKKKLSI